MVIQVIVLMYIMMMHQFVESSNPDTLFPSQQISINQTLISANQIFELGFFIPGNSSSRYLGIWFKTIPETIIWVANRENPIPASDDSARLMLTTTDGNLIILDAKNTILWSTNVSIVQPNRSIVVLSDDGDLIMKDTRSGFVSWQRYAHPCDVFLMTMVVEVNTKTGEQLGLSSWRSETDPGVGNFDSRILPQAPVQSVVRKGGDIYWRSGPWNGVRYVGIPDISDGSLDGWSIRQDQAIGVIYFSVNRYDPSITKIMKLFPDGSVKIMKQVGRNWSITWEAPMNECDVYGTCGSFKVCNANESPICGCVRGFEPESAEEWSKGNWSGGYVCEEEETCKSKKVIVIIFLTSAIFIVVFCFLITFAVHSFRNKHQRRRKGVSKELFLGRSTDAQQLLDWKTILQDELTTFELEDIVTATNDFSHSNKVGQGGFGAVFRGKLHDGQEIAVKRLSGHSGQGIDELLNEILLISKLQHRNLVKVLGCCIETEEKLVVYEYLPNGSLDAFLFDSSKENKLDWATRFNIIQGIARGISYLHRDSRLKVIHRDLKASNVLMDNDMNPKISDFGLARAFQGTDQESADTCRVVGTYGYMSPEYGLRGIFSEKSDVFSFGVLLLEIISGKKTSSFDNSDEAIGLLRHAWKLWNEGREMELVDESLIKADCDQVVRCISVGLVCVQDRADDRPTMPTVILMLNSDMVIPQPKQPLFVPDTPSIEQDIIWSANEDSESLVGGR